MLTAYDRTLLRFEEIIREHREKRNHPSWNFCHYFLLQVNFNFLNKQLLMNESRIIFIQFQEELAFVLEMLGLFDEALVQYDELDALFTQFVLNSNITGK